MICFSQASFLQLSQKSKCCSQGKVYCYSKAVVLWGCFLEPIHHDDDFGWRTSLKVGAKREKEPYN